MDRITVLMENKAEGKNLACEHGLSLLVEYRGKRVLFDCGQSGLFLENAKTLGICLEELDAVALSHSHYDHALGYRDLVEAGLAGKTLYTGEGFWEPKYSRKDNAFQDRSCGFDRSFLEEHRICHRAVGDLEQIFPGMWLISGFARTVDFETVPGKFLRKTAEGMIPDDFRDEICLVLETGEALTAVVGCAHPGIVNMVRHIIARMGKPVQAVYGGTHLLESEESRIEKTLELLYTAGVKTLGFSHCSGEAVERMTGEDPRFQSKALHCGDTIVL